MSYCGHNHTYQVTPTPETIILEPNNIESFNIQMNESTEWVLIFSLKNSEQNFIYNCDSFKECIEKYNIIVNDRKMYISHI
jgi:hypothetical protein